MEWLDEKRRKKGRREKVINTRKAMTIKEEKNH
jgi:hypothetical protein